MRMRIWVVCCERYDECSVFRLDAAVKRRREASVVSKLSHSMTVLTPILARDATWLRKRNP